MRPNPPTAGSYNILASTPITKVLGPMLSVDEFGIAYLI